MQLRTRKDGSRDIKLLKAEADCLKRAKAILTDIREFSRNADLSLHAAVDRIDEDGVLRDPPKETPAETEEKPPRQTDPND